MDLLTFMLVFGVAGTAAFIACAIHSGKKIDAELDAELTAISEFTPTLSYKSSGSRNAIAIDIERKKVAVLLNIQKVGQCGTQLSVYGFDDLLAVEVVRDGASIIKTQRGSQLLGAAVGGALLGGAGLIVGGLSGSKREENKIERLSIKLYTNDLTMPVQELLFIDLPGVGTDPKHCDHVIQEVDQWYGRLRAIIETNKIAQS